MSVNIRGQNSYVLLSFRFFFVKIDYKIGNLQGNYVPSIRNMSTVASVGIKDKEALKFPVNGGPRAQKMIGIWLFGSAAWVFSMVILGGATRLTRSGLSMTDWKFTGGLPPLSDEDWLVEFDKYKQSPEYKRSVQSSILLAIVTALSAFVARSTVVNFAVKLEKAKTIPEFSLVAGRGAIHFWF